MTRLLHELEVHQIELQLQNEELRAARHDLEANLQLYTELFDFAPFGYVTLDAHAAIVEINHAGAAIIGQARERLRGATFTELLAAGDRTAFSALVASAVSGVSRTGVQLQLAQRRQPTLIARARLLSRPQTTVLLSFEDVSEALLRARQLDEARQAIELADRRKDEFLATLSHELRNPLAPIRNSLYLLAHAEEGSDRASRARTVIERQVAQLSRLIDDLLDVTRIARGKVQLKRSRVDLADLVRRATDDHRALFEQSGLTLECRVESGPSWVEADPVRMTQVVANLLGNAAKFTPKGGHVTVSLTRPPGWVRVSVQDDGMGIAPELLPKIFESFVQAPQALSRSLGGLGLGLAMVKGFVELEGGRVSAYSRGQGQGSEFVIELPSRPAPEVAAESPPAGVQPRPRRVLLIEDNVDACTSLRDALEIDGHQVQIAFDGTKGLELARTFQPEVVLCDLGLPGMSGYKVAQAFRAEPALREIYLIALSGYGRPEDVAKATQAGFDRHLTKPPPLELLEDTIARAGASKTRPPQPGEPLLH